MGGRTDDPRRERTRNAPARHRARAGARQRQRRLPRVGDLADASSIAGATGWNATGSTACIRAGSARERGARWRRRRRWSGWCSGSRSARATWGCRRIAAYLARTWQVRVAPSTVQRLLRRVGLATRRARLTVLEQQAARTAGLLTERTRTNALARAATAARGTSRRRSRASSCAWTRSTSVNLKGVGKVWQITACDAASLVWARRPAAGSRCRGRRHVPARRSSCPTTDAPGGRCAASSPTAARSSRAPLMWPAAQLGLRHTRTKPRHAWTNGFVERLQGTILQEHWRVVFRRRYFTTSRGPAADPRWLHALLQHRAAAPRLPRPRSHSGRAGLGRGGAVISFTTLGRRKCQHRFRVWTD